MNCPLLKKKACPPGIGAGGLLLEKNAKYAPSPDPSSTRITRAIRAVYRPLHRFLRLPDGNEGGAHGLAGAGGTGAVGGPGACITPADPPDPVAPPPDADTENGCQEVGVASCGVTLPGNMVPGLLLAADTAGMPPEGGDIEGCQETGVVGRPSRSPGLLAK